MASLPRGRRHRCRGSNLAGRVWACAATVLVALSSAASASISTQSLGPGLTPAQLARTVVGDGVEIGNVHSSGTAEQAGLFAGAVESVGLDHGVILSSGPVRGILPPNNSEHTGLGISLRQPGDADLTELLLNGDETKDAAVLEFDFVSPGTEMLLRYVFASDEYNGEDFGANDDVLGIFVNGQNRALLPDGDIISVYTVNGGLPAHPVNPDFFVANPLCPECPLDFSPDGRTVVLTLRTAVNLGMTNHLKVAIADAGDRQIDSRACIEPARFAVPDLA